MKRALWLVLPLIMATPYAVSAQTPPRSLPVGQCINMGNSLESPSENAWGGKPIAAADFNNIAKAGFKSVRIPVRWDTHMGKEAPYTVDTAYMQRVQQVVSEAQAAGLNVILDSHHFEAMHTDPIGNTPRYAALWRQIGVAFKDYPTKSLWFELENEPHDKFNNANLLEVLTPALAALRETNPDRPVIIGGEFWSGIDSLATLELPNDPNVYPTFHYYEPFNFTHQGATWVDPSPPLGRAYGAEDDAARLTRDVQKVRDYAARSGVMPFIGETGAHTTVSLPERVKYHRAVTEAFAPLGIGMCAWAYTNTFAFYDGKTQQWLPGMLEAFGLPGAVGQAAAQAAPAPQPAPQSAPKAAAEKQPTPELQALDDSLPGVLINDPAALNWSMYGTTMSTKIVKSANIPGGGAAVQFKVTTLGVNAYDAGANVPIRTPLKAQTDYVAVFWARTIASDAPDKKGRISARFGQNIAPYAGFGDTVLTVGPDWQLYEVAARADRDIVKGQAVLGLQVAGARQTIEIGQVIIVEGVPSLKASMLAPVADPEMPPQLAGKGVLLNDPTKRDWALFGASQKATPTTTNVYGRVGTLMTVSAAGANPYDAGASVPISGAIASGDRIRVGFLARTVSASTPDGQGRLGVRIQQGSAPYDGFADNTLTIGPNWRLYQFTTTATMDLPAGTGQFGLHTAGAAQAIEVGPVYIIKEPAPAQ